MKQILFFSLLFIIINNIWNVYIKLLFEIKIGSILTLYKYIFILFFIFFSLLIILLQYKKIIRNSIDRLMILLLSYGLFEILWTYYLTGSFLIGIFRFRLYFISYLLYFPIIFFLRNKYISDVRIIKSIYLISIVCYLWAIIEGYLINVSSTFNELIINSLQDYITIGSTSYGAFKRGIGVLASVTQSGILYSVFFGFFFYYILPQRSVKRKIYIIIGITAIIFSLSKTAWILLIIGVGLAYLKRSLSVTFVFSITIVVFMMYSYHNYYWFSTSVDSNFNRINYYINEVLTLLQDTPGHILFGYGYEITEYEAKVFSIPLGHVFSKSIGSEFFFAVFINQFGIVGSVLFLLLFFIMPLNIYFKNKNTLNISLAISIIVAGFSIIHYNSIFRSGVDIIICIFLAILSYNYQSNTGYDKSLGFSKG